MLNIRFDGRRIVSNAFHLRKYCTAIQRDIDPNGRIAHNEWVKWVGECETQHFVNAHTQFGRDGDTPFNQPHRGNWSMPIDCFAQPNPYGRMAARLSHAMIGGRNRQIEKKYAETVVN